jgi:IrrE N-terminal-like domain
MNMPEESMDEMVAKNKAGSHEYNCETLMGNGALHVSPEFAAHILAVLTALPFDITEKLMELQVAILAVGKTINGLVLDLPPTIHAHPTPGPYPHLNLHTHPGGKLLYFSPFLLETSKEEIRFTIAHEIAHAVLGDPPDSSQNAKATGERQEGEADELAQGWGFKRPPTVPAASYRSTH